MSDKAKVTIVNDKDEIIGYKERGTLLLEDIYRVAALWVTNPDGDILLAQRKFTKSHDPGKWGPAVAGTVDEGETYESNIIKETAEEIGLDVVGPKVGPKWRMSTKEGFGHNYFCQWYTLVIEQPSEDFLIQEDEVEQVRWFPRDFLAKDLTDHPEKYLKSLSRAISEL